MKPHLYLSFVYGFFIVALGGLVGCGGSSNEAAIQDIETRLEELTTQVNEISQKSLELLDVTDNLQAQLDQNKQFIAKGGAGKGQDFSADIAALRAEVEALKKQIGQGTEPGKKTVAAPAGPAASVAPTSVKPATEGVAAPAPPGAVVPATESSSRKRKTGEAKATPAQRKAEAKAPAAETGGGETPAGGYHQVKAGETFESIAQANGISAQALRGANNASAKDQPMANASIWVPGASR